MDVLPGSLVFVQTQHWLRWNDGFPICKERYAPERVDICMKCGQDCLIQIFIFILITSSLWFIVVGEGGGGVVQDLIHEP